MSRGVFRLLWLLAVSGCLPLIRVHGRIVDVETGRPVPDVPVYFASGQSRSISDSAGRFEFRSWPWEDCARLTVRRVGYYTVVINLPPRRGWNYDLGTVRMERAFALISIVPAGGCLPPRTLPESLVTAVVHGRAVDTTGTPLAWHYIEGRCRQPRGTTDSTQDSPRRFQTLGFSDGNGLFSLEFVFRRDAAGFLDTLTTPPCFIRDARAYATATLPQVIRRAPEVPVYRIRLGAALALGDVVLPQP
jgi:hypothetical protein